MKKRVKICTKDNGKKLHIQGIDSNNAPYQFLTKVQVKAIGVPANAKNNNIVLSKEPLVADLKHIPETEMAEITFTYQGHYKEPDLKLVVNLIALTVDP